jgi:DNA polymerase-4
MQERLEHYGLRTVEQALGYDLPTLTRLFGACSAEWLYDRIRGLDPTPIEPRADARSISRDETFQHDILDDVALETELLGLVVRAAGDLRGQALRARTITVRIRDADFTTRQASRTLSEPIESDRAIFQVARPLLRKLRTARRTGARLLGVTVSNLTAANGPTQMSLLEPRDQLESDRDRDLAIAVDRVRARFGDASVRPGRIFGS